MKNILIICVLAIFSVNTYATPQSNIFTYQGELIQNNSPANGNYEMAVSLYTDAVNGTHLLGVNFLSVPVVEGIFTLDIDFGATEFMGDERWLELSVRDFNTPNLTVLSPRQLISNAPYSIHSQFVGSSGVNSDALQTGSVTGIKIADNTITQAKLQNNSIGTLQVINASITEAKLADNSVTTAKIADDAITSDELANNAVTTDSILNGTIVAADIDSNSVQQRISGTCSAGSSIASILANGTVTCENDDVGMIGWGLTGNAGTSPATNFIGTTDNQALEFKVNNATAIKVEPGTSIGLGNIPNIIAGENSNTILPDSSASSISGGKNNSIIGSFSTIGGGINNAVKDDISFIAGGDSNTIETSGRGSFIGGGANNTASGSHSSILGFDNTTKGLISIAIGANSVAGADYSLALGHQSVIRDANQVGSGTTGDAGTFIWSQTGVTSSGSNQVLFEAIGGFGIGTNAPASPMHIKGQGTTFGTLTDEVVMTVEPKETTDNVSLAINKLDTSKESALVFTENQNPEFDIRVVNGGFMTFSNYDAMGASKLMMRIGNSGVNRIDIFANLEPEITNSFDFGSNTYRWRHIYTENITTRNTITTDSDSRLKDHIEDLDYGLADILSMRPVSYQLKKGNTEQIHLGFIAQEIKTIVPEIVSQSDDEKHMLSMRYSELIPVLIKATQEQQVLIDQQSQQILALEKMLKTLIDTQNK